MPSTPSGGRGRHSIGGGPSTRRALRQPSTPTCRWSGCRTPARHAAGCERSRPRCLTAPVTLTVVDADAHVAEGAALGRAAMERWPEQVVLKTDGRPALVIEGRRYPEPEGPGAGCPPEHGLSKVDGINPYTVEGVLADADRDGIDTMVLYPSFGLCAPSLEDPDFAAGFARLYNEWIAGWCAAGEGRLRGVAVTPLEHGDEAIKVMTEA